MKIKNYNFLFYFIVAKVFIVKTNIINDAFPFYPYGDILDKNFEEYCLNMNLKKDCIIDYLSKIDISNLKNISYDFLKSNYENKNNNPSILGDLCSIVLKGLFNAMKNNIIGFIGSTCIDLISSVKNIGKQILNENNEQIILEVEKLLKNEKYQLLVNEWLKKDIEDLIEKSISQLDKTNYIKDFFRKEQNSDKHINLDSKFNGNINSLNFIIFGKKGAGKSTFINNILDLKSINDGRASPNGNGLQLSSVKFTKYKNDKKQGIELIEAKGDNTTDFKKVLDEFDIYFYDKIIYEENNFIYGFIYLNKNNNGNDALAIEKNDLSQLYEYHYGKIPYKIIELKNDNDYNDFINFIFKELNENKLKDIYKYYYSLNVFQIIINKIIITKKLVDILSSVPKSENNIEDIDDVTNITISKLQLDINTLLLRPELNYENIGKTIKKLYTEFINELNEDFEKLDLDYTLEVNKSFSLKNFFIENHPNDIIPIFFYEKIRILLEEIFFNAIKNMTVNYSFSIEKYPDYSNILDIISKNFIISYNNNKFWRRIIRLIIIILIIVSLFIIYNRYYKRNKTENDEGTELENLNPQINNN